MLNELLRIEEELGARAVYPGWDASRAFSGSGRTPRYAGAMAIEVPRRTKIVATLGPASAGRIEELVAAGMDAVRLNFSHGTHG